MYRRKEEVAATGRRTAEEAEKKNGRMERTSSKSQTLNPNLSTFHLVLQPLEHCQVLGGDEALRAWAEARTSQTQYGP